MGIRQDLIDSQGCAGGYQSVTRFMRHRTSCKLVLAAAYQGIDRYQRPMECPLLFWLNHKCGLDMDYSTVGRGLPGFTNREILRWVRRGDTLCRAHDLSELFDEMRIPQSCTRRSANRRWKVVDMRFGRQTKQTRSPAVVSRLLALTATITLFLSIGASCQKAPITPNVPWLPERHPLERDTTPFDIHEALIDGEHVYSLGELVDIAESNSPATQAAWNRAKVTAASVGIAKSELYPTIIATVAGTTYLNPQLFGRSFVLQDWATFDAGVHLAYTLVDFGARRTEISAAQARLVAANLSFNNQHLVLIRQVSQAYFSLLKARGLREAAEVSLNDAKTTEDAAQDRRKNGLATVPEVLEAKAATAKAAYDLQSAIGAEKVEIGNLARAITANPVKQLKVEPLDQLRIPDKLDQTVEDAIDTAFKDRPDLQADEARVRAAAG